MLQPFLAAPMSAEAIIILQDFVPDQAVLCDGSEEDVVIAGDPPLEAEWGRRPGWSPARAARARRPGSLRGGPAWARACGGLGAAC